mgnify:CR=1 FL=1
MPDKVLEHICYGGTIAGGPFDQHRIRVSASREGRKYVPSVTVMGPDGCYLPANPLEIPSAILRTSKESPAAAMDVAFKAMYFYLNNEVAAARINDVQEESKHWIYLDEMGKRDYDSMPDYDTDAYKEFQAEEFNYTPPNSEAVVEAGLMTIGSSASIESDDSVDGDAADVGGQSKGTGEGGVGAGPGSESSVDGNMAADEGLNNFLKSDSGLNPELSSTQGVGTGEKG